MPANRPIRALARGLKVLTVLNSSDGATVSEISAATALPRTTVYRVLETLGEEGYVTRDTADERYRLTILVRGLSDGFDAAAWVVALAKPHLRDLGRAIERPVAIATLSGTSMLVRQTTAHAHHDTAARYEAGYRLPLLECAAGLAFLAFCAPEQRDTLLEVLARSQRGNEDLASQRDALAQALEEIRRHGYAVHDGSRRTADGTSIAVPVTADEQVLALLAVKCSADPASIEAAVQRFVPRLRDTAGAIGRTMLNERKDLPSGAP